MKTSFFVRSRNKLIEALGGGSVAMSGYTAMQKSGDMAGDFLQEANFWYLTGIERPDFWLILDGQRHKSWLVMPQVSEVRAIFDGSLSAEAAQEISGVDAVISRDEATEMLRTMAKTHPVIYTVGAPLDSEYYDFSLNPAPLKMKQMLERTFQDVRDCQKDLARLRAIKEPDEIDAIKRAIALTNDTFASIKQNLDKYTYEYEIEADFTAAFRRKNAQHAYEPIVAAGANACTLHYIENDARLKKRQLVLCDIGARVDGYAADVTRTYALGEPTKHAAAIHAAVEKAQKEIVGLLQPGSPVSAYLEGVDAIMMRAIYELGLATTPDDMQAYRKYMPHAISHGLGIDVHDSLGAPHVFKPGMVLTVEPGLYDETAGVGVRIEDDILITEDGHENLSQRLATSW